MEKKTLTVADEKRKENMTPWSPFWCVSGFFLINQLTVFTEWKGSSLGWRWPGPPLQPTFVKTTLAPAKTPSDTLQPEAVEELFCANKNWYHLLFRQSAMERSLPKKVTRFKRSCLGSCLGMTSTEYFFTWFKAQLDLEFVALGMIDLRFLYTSKPAWFKHSWVSE